MFNLIDFAFQYHRLCVLIVLTLPANLIDFGNSKDSCWKSTGYDGTVEPFALVLVKRVEDDETCTRRVCVSAD